MFYFEKINNKKILKSTLIENAFFTTKESFIKTKENNLIATINQNKKEILNFCGASKIIMPEQRHTSNVSVVDKNQSEYPNTDSLILKDKNILLALNFADCVPLVFYDDVLNYGAIAHAGWRGTEAQIGVLTVKKMLELGSKTTNIKALIGPCISKCCFETDCEIATKLYKTIDSDIKNENNKCYPDLKEINKIQLQKIGIEKIDIAPYCTVCDNDLFFSYRKENQTTNRHSAILQIR
ncbi:MAG: peptidoglycan editing factor PgeF [Cyanobacteria bacterium SIG30]|nr:peptidoglycan editing factor PgeF [Cyanobacteria bacterium SIG30]